MATITIRHSNPHNGHLEMSDGGQTDAHRKETIIWQLAPGCGVKRISNIDIKASSPINLMWERIPHRVGTSDNWEAKIHKNSVDHSEYNYFISWIPTDGTDPDPSHPIKIYDPKIAVKPDNRVFLRIFLMAVASAITAIFSLLFFNKRKARKDIKKADRSDLVKY